MCVLCAVDSTVLRPSLAPVDMTFFDDGHCSDISISSTCVATHCLFNLIHNLFMCSTFFAYFKWFQMTSWVKCQRTISLTSLNVGSLALEKMCH